VASATTAPGATSASVRVLARPWADVFVDGERVDLGAEVDLDPGAQPRLEGQRGLMQDTEPSRAEVGHAVAEQHDGPALRADGDLGGVRLHDGVVRRDSPWVGPHEGPRRLTMSGGARREAGYAQHTRARRGLVPQDQHGLVGASVHVERGGLALVELGERRGHEATSVQALLRAAELEPQAKHGLAHAAAVRAGSELEVRPTGSVQAPAQHVSVEVPHARTLVLARAAGQA